MKQITAYIKPFMLPKVQEALLQAPGFRGMTATMVAGLIRIELRTIYWLWNIIYDSLF
jgi:nitrogen regulatory protein PII